MVISSPSIFYNSLFEYLVSPILKYGYNVPSESLELKKNFRPINSSLNFNGSFKSVSDKSLEGAVLDQSDPLLRCAIGEL